MRYGKVLLFSNCKSPNRRALLYLRASADDGKTWTDGICIEPKGAAYSDMTILPDGDIGILYEGAGYATINFTTVPLADIKAQNVKTIIKSDKKVPKKKHKALKIVGVVLGSAVAVASTVAGITVVKKKKKGRK